MAAQEWDWFQREGLIGQISDIRVQNLQVEREDVQKRTFTRWINLHLEKCDPPLEVKDLFLDIQDGRILMALLEVLSGRNLLHEYKSSSHRIFRLNNIAKALKFLEDSNVKLVSIDAAEIADGNPSLVLGLIWNIILFFQIKELTGNLSRNSPPSSLSPGSGGTDSDSSFPPTPTGERSAALSVKDQRKAIRTLLAWVQRKTRKYGVAVQDFAGSWRSGLAFLAVIKAIDPSLVDMKAALEDSMRENLEKAFRIAHDALHIPRLLEPEDIMVDTPDEQSIVTYVAQFLEHFPELEAEDFVDADKDAPIESTFVRIKETPSEQESTVFYVTDDGERAYTVNHDTSHPPPSKVFVCDTPENWKESRPSGSSGPAPSDSLIEVAWQGMDRDTHGASERTYSLSEPPPESSILSRKDNHRSSSLPIKKTVHFETDIFKDASCNKDPVHSQDFDFEGGRRGTKDWWKQDGRVPVVAEEKPKQDAPGAPEAASDQALGDISLADSRTGLSPTAQSSAPGNRASERPAGPGEESRPRALLGEETVTADPSEVIEVTLQTVEAMDEEDDFEGIPLKASKFNSDLVDFASTSQAFGEDPPPPEDRPAEEQAPEEQAEKLGKRRSKSAHRMEAPDDPPETPEQEDGGCVLAPEEEPAGKKPEVYEKAKRKSPRPPRGEEEGEAEDPPELGGNLPSNPPSSQVSLETLGSHSEEGLDFKRSPPLSKVSVIPHDLFYYPHYEVPLAAVLEAYAEGPEDFKTEDVDFEDPEDYLSDLEPREDEDEPEASESSGSFGGLGEDLSHSPTQEPDRGWGTPAAKPASDPPPAALAPEDHQPREAEARAPAESQQESPNSGNVRSPLEEKATEESVSSKKKEKKKHVDDVESSILLAPGAGRSSDDLEEDPGFHRVPSRTSHSDSSIYIRRHTNRSLESDHSSYVQLRNAADLDDRRNRMLTRKANHSGEASLREGQSPHSDALAQFVQQPDMMYFILFLWLLVYCLLLFPQLDVNRL